MKGEHRKELETNALADRIGKFLTKFKGERKYALWLVAALAGIMLIVWYWFASSSPSQTSTLWTQYDAANSVQLMEKIAEANPGTNPAMAAQFQIARHKLHEGILALGTPSRRTEAVGKILDARKLYKKLLDTCKSYPTLAQEALMSLASSEESLVGIPDPGKPEQSAGDLDQAIAHYQELTRSYPESPPGKEAASRLKLLEDPKEKARIRTFYEELNTRTDKKAP